jgi:hypothetical protein
MQLGNYLIIRSIIAGNLYLLDNKGLQLAKFGRINLGESLINTKPLCNLGRYRQRHVALIARRLGLH